jgi:hypothetical protein
MVSEIWYAFHTNKIWYAFHTKMKNLNFATRFRTLVCNARYDFIQNFAHPSDNAPLLSNAFHTKFSDNSDNAHVFAMRDRFRVF